MSNRNPLTDPQPGDMVGYPDGPQRGITQEVLSRDGDALSVLIRDANGMPVKGAIAITVERWRELSAMMTTVIIKRGNS